MKYIMTCGLKLGLSGLITVTLTTSLISGVPITIIIFVPKGMPIHREVPDTPSVTVSPIIPGVNVPKEMNVPTSTGVTQMAVSKNTQCLDATKGHRAPLAPIVPSPGVGVHPHKTNKLPTPIKPDRLASYLSGYSPTLSRTLIDGFTHGFSLRNFSFTTRDKDKNLHTAKEHPEVVSHKIAKELSLGRIMGPFIHCPFDNPVISPLGLQPKKEQGKFRVIHDLSYPEGASINAGIPREFSSVKYSSVSDAVQCILRKGRGAFLAKTDIESAFRIIPLRPSDYHLLGFKWNNLYYFDRCLPMGASSSCAIFELFSTALHWIISRFLPGVGVVHVLDDFLFIGPSFEACSYALKFFLFICQDIGVPISTSKTMGPATILPFLGIQLNTVSMSASLPADKIQKCTSLIQQFLHSKSVTLKQLQAICGHLNFACSIIIPARAFTRRLYDLCVGVAKPYFRVKLTNSVKLDLRVWQEFLLNYNFQTFLLDFRWQSSRRLHLYTDSSTSVGFGGVFGTRWFHGVWEDSCKGLDICLLELYPICLTLLLWGGDLANQCITLHSDNQAVVAILNSNTSKDHDFT